MCYAAVKIDKGCLRTQIANEAEGIGSLSDKALPTEATTDHLKTSASKYYIHLKWDTFIWSFS